jgi:serpin B
MAADSHDTSEDPRSDYTSAVSATTAFGMKIFRELAERDSNNILISPVGLGVALTMTYNGAAGETAREMAGVLELDALDPQEVNNAHAELIGKLPVSGDDLSLSMANSLWADLETPFREDFLATSEASYRAAIRNIDLGAPEAPDSINAWVGRETGERIGSVIQEIDPDVVLYLINAMYFRGRWAIPFDTSYTSPRVFTLADGSTRTVPLMMTELRQGHYYSGDGFMAARLDYGVGQASMYLFLPDEDSSLEEFCGRLNADNWTRWVSGFEIGPARILLPRLTLEYDGVLNGALRTLGMRRAFAGADFRRMTSERVFISMVKHSTRLEVDEAGTVAASAAVVELKKGPATVLAFTRPFFLAVVDNRTGAILFMGSVLEP